MVMDVWQASLMRAFATQLAQEQGELEDGDEEWQPGSSDDDEGWEWPDEDAVAAAEAAEAAEAAAEAATEGGGA